MWLVVRSDAIEESVFVQFAEKRIVMFDDLFQGVIRGKQQVVSDRVGYAQRQDAQQCVRRSLVGEDSARVVFEENILRIEGRKCLVHTVDREVVR